jgi:hypothetical protein
MIRLVIPSPPWIILQPDSFCGSNGDVRQRSSDPFLRYRRVASRATEGGSGIQEELSDVGRSYRNEHLSRPCRGRDKSGTSAGSLELLMSMTDWRTRSRVGWAGAGILIVALVAALALLGPQRPETTESLGPLADPDEVYNPVWAGEPTPPGFRQLLGRDSILPVYEPDFAPAGAVEWPGDVLVIGVAGERSAKAYPVSHLNRREMVIDALDGIPILVTW